MLTYPQAKEFLDSIAGFAWENHHCGEVPDESEAETIIWGLRPPTEQELADAIGSDEPGPDDLEHYVLKAVNLQLPERYRQSMGLEIVFKP